MATTETVYQQSNDTAIYRDTSSLSGDHGNCNYLPDNDNPFPYALVGESGGYYYASETIFKGVDVPQGATINSATLHTHITGDTGDTDARFYCEKADDPSVPSSLSDFTGRYGTGNYEVHSLGSNVNDGDDWAWDVTDEVQDVVDRSGFSSGNNIGLFIVEDGSATGYKSWGEEGNTYLEIEYESPVSEPVAETNAADSIGEDNATLNGTVFDDGGEDCDVRFRYRESGGTWNYTSWQYNFGTYDEFDENLSGLNSDTTYEFEAIVENSAGTDYGSQKSFTTDKAEPTCTTDSATNVDSSSATLNGTIDSMGDYGTVYYRWWYEDQSTGVSYWTDYKANSSAGNVSDSLSALNSDTQYQHELRVYTSEDNSDITDYGGVLSFTTETAYGTLKYYDGASWVKGSAKYYDGASWVKGVPKVYIDGAWREIDQA